jgi:hypothetical protein
MAQIFGTRDCNTFEVWDTDHPDFRATHLLGLDVVEVRYDAQRTSGPVFPASYDGWCRRCGHRISAGDPAQYVEDEFGHAVCPSPLISEEKGMNINTRIKAAERVLGSLYEEAERASRFLTDEDYEVGAVLIFTRKFRGSPKEYTFTAAKCGRNLWYISGSVEAGRGRTFDHLVEQHLLQAEEVTIVTQTEVL